MFIASSNIISKMRGNFNSFTLLHARLKPIASLFEGGGERSEPEGVKGLRSNKKSSSEQEEQQSNELHVAQLSDGRLIIARHVIFLMQIARHFAGSALTIQQGNRTDGSRKENNHKKNSQHNVASLSNIQNHEGL